MISDAERAELVGLHAKVRRRDAGGGYVRWTDAERDRVRALMRKADPSIQFAPSTAEMARRFGHLAREKGER